MFRGGFYFITGGLPKKRKANTAHKPQKTAKIKTDEKKKPKGNKRKPKKQKKTKTEMAPRKQRRRQKAKIRR